MVDIDKVLKNTIKNGKVKIGIKETKQTINKGDAKIVIISNNCPKEDEIKKLAKKKKIPVYDYDNNSIDLGYTCGKSFAVSSFAVIDAGNSKILNVLKKR